MKSQSVSKRAVDVYPLPVTLLKEYALNMLKDR